MAAAMFGGGRSGLFNFSRAAAFPNPSPPKSSRLCFQYARSSQADSNESDYGDVKGKDSMKEYVNKAEEEAEKAKEKTEEGASAARDKASDAAEKTRDTMKAGFEKTKETAEAAKEKSKSMAEKAKKRAEKSKEGAQSIGEKAKQTVQGAWEAAKETTNKIKETVVGKDEEDALEDVGKAPPREDVSAARNKAAEDQANKRGRETN